MATKKKAAPQKTRPTVERTPVTPIEPLTPPTSTGGLMQQPPTIQPLVAVDHPLGQLAESIFNVQGDIKIDTNDLVMVPINFARQQIERQLRLGKQQLQAQEAELRELAEQLAAKLNRHARETLFAEVIEAGRTFYAVRKLPFKFDVSAASVSQQGLQDGSFQVELRMYSESYKQYSYHDQLNYRNEATHAVTATFAEAGADGERQRLLAKQDQIAATRKQLDSWSGKLAELPRLQRDAQLAITATVLSRVAGGSAVLQGLTELTNNNFLDDLEAFGPDSDQVVDAE